MILAKSLQKTDKDVQTLTSQTVMQLHYSKAAGRQSNDKKHLHLVTVSGRDVKPAGRLPLNRIYLSRRQKNIQVHSNMAEFSRAIRENPALLLLDGAPQSDQAKEKR